MKLFQPLPSIGKFKRISKKAYLPTNYSEKIKNEIASYRYVENVANLPIIHGYWAHKYVRTLLEPFGFTNEEEFYLKYIRKVCTQYNDEKCRIIALGSGNCNLEISLAKQLLEGGTNNFHFECTDLNNFMLDRGKSRVAEENILDMFTFTLADINNWIPTKQYHIFVANHSLHHFVELEKIFDGIFSSLKSGGYFLTHDMIGRNGHMRWPEALMILNAIWNELPEKYKYNHMQKRLEIEYDNFDCSTDGFEGIRAQDILPLLIKRFNFELFIPFGNIIDIFVDRCFGHNFDASNENDLALIDHIQKLDQEKIEQGEIKPTHMYAAMLKDNPQKQYFYKHLTPKFCVRNI